jgi:hypothetical protein
MCVRGDQQVEGQDFFQQDLYTPTLKAQEARLIAAIAAQHGTKLFKTNCKQAFLYGEMDDVEIYIKKPDWWPEVMTDMSCYCARVCMVPAKQQGSGTSASHGGWLSKDMLLSTMRRLSS